MSTYNGSRVRIAPAGPEYAKVKLTSAHLRAVPKGQPPGFSEDAVALAMHKHRKANENMSGLAHNPRKFVALRMNTSPLLPAVVLTAYAVQGGEFERFVIHETNPPEIHTQLSRGNHGLSSLSFADDFKSGFKPTARLDTEVEIARLEELHRNTKRAFNFECLAPSSRATKAREGGGGSVGAPEI